MNPIGFSILLMAFTAASVAVTSDWRRYCVLDFIEDMAHIYFNTGLGAVGAAVALIIYLPDSGWQAITISTAVCPVAVSIILHFYLITLQLRPNPSDDQAQNQANEQASDNPQY